MTGDMLADLVQAVEQRFASLLVGRNALLTNSCNRPIGSLLLRFISTNLTPSARKSGHALCTNFQIRPYPPVAKGSQVRWSSLKRISFDADLTSILFRRTSLFFQYVTFHLRYF